MSMFRWRRAIRTSAATLASDSETLNPVPVGKSTGTWRDTSPATTDAARASAPSASCTRRLEPPTCAFSSADVPSATLRPRSMTAIRSASWSASSRYWVVSRMVQPSATSPRIVSHI